MSKDFEVSQVKLSTIIASSSDGSKNHPSLLIYSSSKASDFEGNIPAEMVVNVGNDAMLFISGTIGKKGTDGASVSTTVFGGDTVVSGTIYTGGKDHIYHSNVLLTPSTQNYISWDGATTGTTVLQSMLRLLVAPYSGSIEKVCVGFESATVSDDFTVNFFNIKNNSDLSTPAASITLPLNTFKKRADEWEGTDSIWVKIFNFSSLSGNKFNPGDIISVGFLKDMANNQRCISTVVLRFNTVSQSIPNEYIP